MTTEVKVTETVTNGQQDRSDYTAEADLARNIASYVSNEKERRCVYLCAKEHLQAMRLAGLKPGPAAGVEQLAIRLAHHLIIGLLDREGGGTIVEQLDKAFFDKAALAARNQRHHQADDATVERAAKAYAEATGYYTQFHRGLSSPSADKIRAGIKAAIAAMREDR